jgi:hypothetical protein
LKLRPIFQSPIDIWCAGSRKFGLGCGILNAPPLQVPTLNDRAHQRSPALSGAAEDGTIAEAVQAALDETGYWHDDEISVTVADAWVTLSGQIEWDFQKRTALYTVRSVHGVQGVTDNIVLRFAPLTLASPHFKTLALTPDAKLSHTAAIP